MTNPAGIPSAPPAPDDDSAAGEEDPGAALDPSVDRPLPVPPPAPWEDERQRKRPPEQSGGPG
ncbi:hypothetical protein [Xylophilus sp.]|uniref:hypothetical protein n=1 Tax=Xylophilus sp. TaxID=2653893 RepID=UPI0013BD722F|nr:hypothetical protein [Xylophilus sp.]KAF1049463.1 MAG: hypothetical protein GAK38_00555 [Xylophilus sp.]